MDSRPTPSARPSRNPIFPGLADETRSRILGLLRERSSAVDLRELAVQLVAARDEKSLLEVTEAETEPIQARLRHHHVPVLENADLLAYDRDADAVELTDHPVLRDPAFDRLLETDVDGWEAVVATLAQRRRRLALSVLKDSPTAIQRAALARAIAGREAKDATGPDPTTVRELSIALHHVHLPKLDDADLVAYDAEGGTVEYLGHPALDEGWLEGDVPEPGRVCATDAD